MIPLKTVRISCKSCFLHLTGFRGHQSCIPIPDRSRWRKSSRTIRLSWSTHRSRSTIHQPVSSAPNSPSEDPQLLLRRGRDICIYESNSYNAHSILHQQYNRSNRYICQSQSPLFNPPHCSWKHWLLPTNNLPARHQQHHHNPQPPLLHKPYLRQQPPAMPPRHFRRRLCPRPIPRRSR